MADDAPSVVQLFQDCHQTIREQKYLLQALRKHCSNIPNALDHDLDKSTHLQDEVLAKLHRFSKLQSLASEKEDAPNEEELVRDDAKKCTARLIGITCRLLCMWYDSLRGKVCEAQKNMLKALDSFDEHPSELALHKTLVISRAFADDKEMFAPSNPTDYRGPPGNPFQVDHELTNLYQDTILDTLHRVRTRAKQNHTYKTERPACDSFVTHESNSAFPQHVTTTNMLNGCNHAEQSNTNNSVQRYTDPGKIDGKHTRRSHSEISNPQRRSSSSSSGTSSRSTAGQMPQHHDSSRVRSLLGGDSEITSNKALNSLPVTCNPPNSVGSMALHANARLHRLKDQLARMEHQIHLGNGDSGSESKYYAVNKRIQALRAEILKEERVSVPTPVTIGSQSDLGKKITAPASVAAKDWTRQTLALRNHHSPRPF